MAQTWVGIGVGVLIAILVAVAEWIHARRVVRIGRLAFGPDESPRRWTRLVSPLRVLSLGAFAWALTTLILLTTGFFAGPGAPIGAGTKHLVFVADLSPSMYLKDAGPNGDQPRRERVAEVIDGVLERVGGDVTFSIIGFYTDALPVVLQVRDREVVRNVLKEMPLVYAMGPGQTDLALSMNRSLELIASFRKNSAKVFVCTDGDSTALLQPIIVPPSVDAVTVLGVGDRERGTFIDGHQSRQDVAALRTIASAMKAEYIDINTRHVPTSAMADLVVRQAAGRRMSLKEIAIAVMAVSASILAFIPVAQQYAGTRWRIVAPPASKVRTA